MKKHVFIVVKTRTGFSSFAQDFKTTPVATTGDTLTEVKQNLVEAFNLLLEHTGKKPVTEEDISIRLDLEQFFEYYKVINAKALGERIGMNQSLLSQYISGLKTPSPNQVEKIICGIRKLGKELQEVEFA